MTMMATALYLATGLKYDDWGVSAQRNMVLGLAALLPALTLGTFGAMRIYRRAWSNANVDDVVRMPSAPVPVPALLVATNR